jgi:hypothetical protein
MYRRTFSQSLVALASSLSTTMALAQANDNKPIEWVVGFAAGGGSDAVARAVAESMSKTLNRTIVVNNKQVPVVDQIFWAGYSCVTYLPASAAPIGQTSDGLPIGVQIVGPQYGDYDCIQFAKLLDKEYRSFVPPPAYLRHPESAHSHVP